MAAPDTRRRMMNGKPDRRVEEALERLQKGVSRILDGEGFKRYLSVAARFHRYSANNCLLILLQRPDATRVAGYRKWQQLGRQVRKGEKGIKILAPISCTIAEDEETGEKVRALVGFKTATVFDVSQTDGEPLPRPPAPEDLDHDDSEGTAKRVYEGLLSFCEAEGVAVRFEERRRGEYGSYRRGERRITLNTALPATERATTLAHELAHHLLHAQADGTAKAAREIEAEGAAFVVCAAFGLDTSRFTFAYVANYFRKPETLKAALERIQGAARRLIEAVEDLPEGTTQGGRS